MSGTELTIKAYFQDEAPPRLLSDVLNSAKKDVEIDFAKAIDGYAPGLPEIEPECWYMSYCSNFKVCLTLRLYGRGDEHSLCRLLESIGALLVSVKAFNDQVGEHYEFGWRNGKSIKQRTVNSELKKIDPYIAFHEAIKKGHVGKVKNFIDEGVDINAPLLGVMTPLMHAAYAGKEKVIKVLVDAGVDVNAETTGKLTALLYAVINLSNQLDHDDLSAIETLLSYGADPNRLASNPKKSSYSSLIYRSEDISPLMLATQYSLSAVKLLVENGADVNQSNSQGFTPLMFALETYQFSISISKYLIDKGADINAVDYEGTNCLEYAGTTSEMDYILRELGAHYLPVKYSEDNASNLLKAISVNDIDKVARLTAHMEVNAELDMGAYKTYALVKGVKERRFEIVQFLIGQGADIMKIDTRYKEITEQRESLMLDACRAGRLNMVEALISHGIDTSFLNKHSNGAIDFALKSKFPKEYSEKTEIVTLLLDHNAPLGESLEVALKNKEQTIIDLLVDSGALKSIEDTKKVFYRVFDKNNIEFVEKHAKWMTDNGLSFFNLTTSLESIDGLEFLTNALPILIHNNLSVNKLFANTYYFSPLNSVVMALMNSGSIKNRKSELLIQIFDILLEAGANPDLGLHESRYSLIMMLQKKKDRQKLIEKLLAHGADLHHTADLGPGSAYELLINKEEMFEGNTNALMLAAANGNLDLVKLFIEHGADPQFENPVEGSVLQVAERFNRKQVVDYLNTVMS